MYAQPATLPEIGGLELLKDWLLKRREAFGQEAKAYGLPAPKGLLIVEFPAPANRSRPKPRPVCSKAPLLADAGDCSPAWSANPNQTSGL